MSNCCDSTPYGRMFDDKEARRRLKGYRRRGLDDMATRLAGYMTERGITGRTVLEVGGGVGDFQVELLKAGASASTNVELSDGYEEAAADLMEAEGLIGRAERVIGDFVERESQVETADIVLLNRVVCCYPWMERLIKAAAGKTEWMLALSVPRDRRLSRALVAIGNGLNKLRGCGFQGFVHPIAGIEAAVLESSLTPVFSATDLMWQGIVYERQ